MKITEITKFARQIIKQLESLFVSYGTYGSIDKEHAVRTFINEHKLSEDPDIQNQCEIYKNKLNDILIRIMSK